MSKPTTSTGLELAKRLRDAEEALWHRSLYKEAEACREAAAFLSHPVDTGQGVGEDERDALYKMVYPHVGDDGLTRLLCSELFQFFASRPPLASVEGVDNAVSMAVKSAKGKLGTARAAVEISNRKLAQSGRSSADPICHQCASKERGSILSETCIDPAFCGRRLKLEVIGE